MIEAARIEVYGEIPDVSLKSLGVNRRRLRGDGLDKGLREHRKARGTDAP